MNNYSEELEFAKAVAKKAGKAILDGFSHATVTIKSNVTPVTEVDIKVSTLVQEEIRLRYPTHMLLDEELQNTESDAEYLWICDPIDGTIPFSHKTPTSMFSLALCHNKKPVVAVIYDAFMDRMLYSKVGDHTYLNDTVVTVSNEPLMKGDTVYIIPYWFDTFDYNVFYAECKKMNLLVSTVQSYVYQAMLVALGITKVAIMSHCSPWDRAAAILIIQNAGGYTIDEDAQPFGVFGDGKVVLISNAQSQESMLSLVKRCLD